MAATLLELLGEVKGLEMVVVGKEDFDKIERTVKVDKKHHSRWKRLPNTRGDFVQKRGTVGYGGMSGGYESEWWDQCAYSILRDVVYFELISECFYDDEPPKNIKHLKNPSNIFKYARKMINDRRNSDIGKNCSGYKSALDTRPRKHNSIKKQRG